MAQDLQERIQELNNALTVITAEESMTEAGRKILLSDFIRMLQNETGSRSGEDIENVHQMRVATRRMRSAFRLLEGYLSAHSGNPYRRTLRKIADKLGAVRDLDVMISEMQAYQKTLGEADQPLLEAIIEHLDSQRSSAREALNDFLDSKAYRGFIKAYSAYLTTPTKPQPIDGAVPFQVRHLLPDLIYRHVSAVRAYDAVVANAIADMDIDTLHQLRIEFKRLRYAVHFFEDVMGSGAANFIKDLKAIQDHLGRINDLRVASSSLYALLDEAWLNEEQAAVVRAYADSLMDELPALVEAFGEVWERFNTKTVQRKLANAVIV